MWSRRRCCCISAAGLLYTSNPQTAPNYDQSQLFPQGLPFADATHFPYLAGHVQRTLWRLQRRRPLSGRAVNTGVAFTLTPKAWDTKPTFNANTTYVKGNHTYKLGATAAV